MGANLVRLAWAQRTRHPVTGKALSIHARMIVVRMAHTALDAPKDDKPAGYYWQGWKPLIEATRGDVSEPCGAGRKCPCEHCKKYRSDVEFVRRKVAELVEHRLIERTTVAQEGRRQKYRILFTRPNAELGHEAQR